MCWLFYVKIVFQNINLSKPKARILSPKGILGYIVKFTIPDKIQNDFYSQCFNILLEVAAYTSLVSIKYLFAANYTLTFSSVNPQILKFTEIGWLSLTAYQSRNGILKTLQNGLLTTHLFLLGSSIYSL